MAPRFRGEKYIGESMDYLRYEAPDTLGAAMALLADEGANARILAGGTDVLVQMHNDMAETMLLPNSARPGRGLSIASNSSDRSRSKGAPQWGAIFAMPLQPRTACRR